MRSILRFLSYTEISEKGCWTWKGAVSGDGYGSFTHKKRQIGAHRFSAKNLGGCDIDGQVVRHKCDNPLCVNPDHLITGTQEDNVNDMIRRGRKASTRGTLNPNTKLTEIDVLAIRSSTEPIKVLATRYRICADHAQRIRSGKRWRHLNNR